MSHSWAPASGPGSRWQTWLRPRTSLAHEAGLAVNRGIVTNRLLATSAPNVHALGDCAEVDGHTLPYVMPIMQQARALAATLAGTPTPVLYPAMPVIVKTPACPTVVCPPPLVGKFTIFFAFVARNSDSSQSYRRTASISAT